MTVRAIASIRQAKPEAPAALPAVHSEALVGLPTEVAAVVSKAASGKRRVRLGEFLYRSGTPFIVCTWCVRACSRRFCSIPKGASRSRGSI
jgi:hypothetical protein